MEKEFTLLINKHRGIIFKVCHIYCDGLEERKDLFQEIVLQTWKSFQSFRNESSVSTWIYRIALNTALSQFKKEKNKPQGKSISEAEFEIPDFEQSEDGKLMEMYKAIEQLTAIEKAIVMLYLEEKNYEETAEIVGISKTHVGVKLNRIKQKLSKIVLNN